MNLWLAKKSKLAIFVDKRSACIAQFSDTDNFVDKHTRKHGPLKAWVAANVKALDALPVLLHGVPLDFDQANFQITDFGKTHDVALLHPVPHESMLTYQAVVDGKSAAVQFFVRVSKKSGKERATTHMRIRQLNEDGALSFLILEH